jgi:hypothetical protein
MQDVLGLVTQEHNGCECVTVIIANTASATRQDIDVYNTHTDESVTIIMANTASATR